MKAEKREVNIYKKVYICDCGGTMESTGIMYPAYPPKYEYKCPDCGYEETTTEADGIVFEEVTGNDN